MRVYSWSHGNYLNQITQELLEQGYVECHNYEARQLLEKWGVEPRETYVGSVATFKRIRVWPGEQVKLAMTAVECRKDARKEWKP